MRFGFRRSQARSLACPRYVAGRRCKQMSAPPNNQCGTHFGWFDHSYQWISPEKHRIFTTEPYANSIGDLDLRKLQRGADELDLVVTSFDRHDSMWFPSSTVLIVVHPPAWAPDEQMRRAYYRWIRKGEPPL